MPHTDLAYSAAVLGAVACAGVLLGRSRLQVISGLVLLTAAEAALAVALVPAHDLRRLVSPSTHVVGLLAMALVVAAAAAAFVRYPGTAPVVLLLAAPFRI